MLKILIRQRELFREIYKTRWGQGKLFRSRLQMRSLFVRNRMKNRGVFATPNNKHFRVKVTR